MTDQVSKFTNHVSCLLGMVLLMIIWHWPALAHENTTPFPPDNDEVIVFTDARHMEQDLGILTELTRTYRARGTKLPIYKLQARLSDPTGRLGQLIVSISTVNGTQEIALPDDFLESIRHPDLNRGTGRILYNEAKQANYFEARIPFADEAFRQDCIIKAKTVPVKPQDANDPYKVLVINLFETGAFSYRILHPFYCTPSEIDAEALTK